MNYVVTFVKEKEVDEPLYSTNDDGVYISGWVRTKRKIMYNTKCYGINNIEDFLKEHSRSHPGSIPITWREYKRTSAQCN